MIAPTKNNDFANLSLPKDWDYLPLKRLVTEPLKYGANESAEYDDPAWPRYVRITDVTENGKLREETFRSLPPAIASDYLLKHGDILFARSGATSGKSFMYRDEWGPCAYAGYMIRARLNLKKCNPNFLRYFTASTLYWAWISSSLIQATIQNVSAEKYNDIRIPLPDPDEQKQIARFLDSAVGKIDTLVSKKRELIELLQEKRRALVSRCVTRGLPPDAARAAGLDPQPKLKPSGVDWLGDVPEHWDVVQLRRKWDVLDCKHKTVSFVDDEDAFPLASIREVSSFEVDLSNAKRTTREEYLDMIDGERDPRIGDIIYSRNATVGDASIVATEKPFCMGQDVCLIRSVSQHPRYVIYMLRSIPLLEQAESMMIGSTFRRINVGQIKQYWTALPPHDEQVEIAKYLDTETSRIDTLLAKVDEATERLTEYRSALITAAVTGKIDVREVEV